MQTKMQEELAAMRIEATSGGGMVKIEMSGAKESPRGRDREGRRGSRGRRDAAGPRAGRVPRSVASRGRGGPEEDASLLGRNAAGDAVALGRDPEVARAPRRRVPAASRNRGQERRAAGLPPAALLRRGGRAPGERDPRIARGGAALLDLQHADRGGSVRDLRRIRSATRRDPVRRRGARQPRRDREDAGVQGPVPRALGGPLAAEGDRARRDRRRPALWPGSHPRSGRSSSRRTRTSRGRRRRSTSRGA